MLDSTTVTCKAYAIVVTIRNQDAKLIIMARGKKIILDEKQMAWLIKHFKHTKNEECAAYLGVSMRATCRIAADLGLRKSKQFMRKLKEASLKLANESNRRNNRYPPKGFIIPRSEEFRFKKGENNLMRLGKKREAERLAKANATRAATYKSEKARATFGLPQRTRMRVIPQPRAKVLLRHYLKKRNYIVDDVKRIVYYGDETKRGERIEAKLLKWYKLEELIRQAQ